MSQHRSADEEHPNDNGYPRRDELGGEEADAGATDRVEHDLDVRVFDG